MKSFLLVALIVAGAMAAEEPRDKRGLLLGAPAVVAAAPAPALIAARASYIAGAPLAAAPLAAAPWAAAPLGAAPWAAAAPWAGASWAGAPALAPIAASPLIARGSLIDPHHAGLIGPAPLVW